MDKNCFLIFLHFHVPLHVVLELNNCSLMVTVNTHLSKCDVRAPFHKGLRLIACFLHTRFAIELRLISIVRLIVTLCESGPRSHKRLKGIMKSSTTYTKCHIILFIACAVLRFYMSVMVDTV